MPKWALLAKRMQRIEAGLSVVYGLLNVKKAIWNPLFCSVFSCFVMGEAHSPGHDLQHVRVKRRNKDGPIYEQPPSQNAILD